MPNPEVSFEQSLSLVHHICCRGKFGILALLIASTAVIWAQATIVFICDIVVTTYVFLFCFVLCLFVCFSLGTLQSQNTITECSCHCSALCCYLASISSVLCISFRVKCALFHADKALDDLTFHTSCTFSVSIHLISLSVPDIHEHRNTPRALRLQDFCTFGSLCLGCSPWIFTWFVPFSSRFLLKCHLLSEVFPDTLYKIIPICDTFYLLFLLYFSALYYWLPNVDHVLLIYLLYYLLLSLEHKFIEYRDLCFIHCSIPCS